MGVEVCGLDIPLLDFSQGDVAINARIDQEDSCYYIVQVDQASEELDVQVSEGKVEIYDWELKRVHSIAGLRQFYLFTEVTSEFEVTTGGIGNTQEKLEILVNDNGDEQIDEIIDTQEDILEEVKDIEITDEGTSSVGDN